MNNMFPQSNPNNNMNMVSQVLGLLNGGSPEQMLQQMINSNPQIAQFMEQNKGKSPQQVAQENGIDLGSLMGNNR